MTQFSLDLAVPSFALWQHKLICGYVKLWCHCAFLGCCNNSASVGAAKLAEGRGKGVGVFCSGDGEGKAQVEEWNRWTKMHREGVAGGEASMVDAGCSWAQ